VDFAAVMTHAQAAIAAIAPVDSAEALQSAEVALAVEQGLQARDLAGSMHANPTYNGVVWNAAIAEVQVGLRRPTAQRVMRLLGRFRRRRVSH